ncbi:hypothetical protein [Nocardiopsis ganjiahuensis]|uniref:hypothetical protein n=1 Tax=Nocardiopsis ganjiahuensis TaxID=239984 RepID=UPI001268B191|nr:hypothetical protein [Nocardiopsis ganjiahuensis]
MRIDPGPGASADSLADTSQRYAERGVGEEFFDFSAAFTHFDQMLVSAIQVIARNVRSWPPQKPRYLLPKNASPRAVKDPN